jgi:hypothetical protein
VQVGCFEAGAGGHSIGANFGKTPGRVVHSIGIDCCSSARALGHGKHDR